MRERIIKGDCWVHVFNGSTFSGKGRRLGCGEKERVCAVQSMIVGPGATAEIVDQKGLEVVKLQPCQLVTNLSKLVANTPAFRVEVKEA